ncbi:LamG-like jellyroll fold domain-containing protein [Flavobacterium seoulense]|uniref:DNA-dirted RNA polymerase n=1 Tax=Flavobacterium seoulense TaxID=1492738 RepID=A0A066WTJ5_9FLAO|nr:LamG-like jellyroll fold domain-containing protein [Flavobacterium seoulense]KDN54304.1 DNA-dirted RNA polymerase [Flavobacterium seoulense]
MVKFYFERINNYLFYAILLFIAFYNSVNAQTLTSPQVNFSQRTAAATPGKTIYNINGDFTMLGNTNLTLSSYDNNKNNEGNAMVYVDIDGNNTTLNSSMATLELSNSGENSANENCSTVLFAGLYWTGKSDDANETFSVTKNSLTKNYNKKTISLKGPKATSYTTITANSDIRFPGSAQSGIFVGFQEVTQYVKAQGPGAYTVADIALKEGTNGTSAQNPGFFGGWVMVVIYENPTMKSRAVTLFDGYAYVNGQRSGGGEYGNIPISGFTTVASGQVNMKLGVMAAEGDVNSNGDYLAVQKQDLNPTVYPGNYLVFNNTATPPVTNNFFNSSIFPQPAAGKSNPIYKNNTGIDFNMFTVPNSGNSIIKNNQTSTNFRFGSTYEVFTIFGFAMSVDAYIPEPKGLISVNSINNVTNPAVLNALPGQAINYSLAVSNSGTEAINNTVISIPIPNTAVFNSGSISYSTHNGFSTPNIPTYDSTNKRIIWNLGTLPTTAGHPEYIYANLSFNLNVTNDCNIIINEGCNTRVSLQTGTITGTGATSGTPTTVNFFQGYDNTACKKPIEGSIIVAIDGTSCLTTMAGTDQIASCGLESVKLAATPGSTGTWLIVNGPGGGGELFSNSSSPSSEFYSPNNGTYTLRWTVSGGGSCPDISDEVQITLNPCAHLDFDGTDDNVDFKNNFNLNNGSFSIEVWIKSEATNNNIQTILSKRNTAINDGYDLRLVNNIISFNWNNGNSISSSYPISTGRWYHVAVTFNGSNYNLYIDGVSIRNEVAGLNPIANSNAKFILGAMAQNITFPYTPINFFDGWTEELRIWNTALTAAQIRQMMNQRIINNSNSVFGVTVPLAVSGLTWANLEGYYPMIQTSDLVNGYLLDKSPNARNGRLLNISTPQPETAPLPYTSKNDGTWEANNTWTNGTVWNIPNTKGIDNTTFIDWNIVQTANNITTAGNKTVLGLLVNNNTLSANSNNKIEISHYLKLNGKIDLVNKSQLIQPLESVLDVTSSGFIERDQQGQSNLYNYNYWSSPVGTVNTTANNVNYTVGNVMKDGTTTTPQNIRWIGGDRGTPTSPISIPRYWLFKFDNYVNAYASWVQINENSAIRVGQGYTMKGSGASTATQNYTFVGKPNNGLINSNSVSASQLLLAGNPYPSALDSEAFINDNENSINGSIYFWEHYASNNSHFLKDYQGGYAIRNKTGGVAPSSANVDFISKLGTPSRGIPNRFIPVGQGFLLIGKTGAGGTITYNNNQRAFHKEDDSGNSNVIFKISNSNKTAWRNSNNDTITEEKHKKIRLGFNSHNDYHRQLLLGFIDGKATNKIDYGYDAQNMDNFPNDMFFQIEDNQFIIQGVDAFDKNASYPLGVKTNAEGIVKFMIDELENFDDNQAVYIFDNETNKYYNIREKQFEVNLTPGINTTRFSLRFINPADSPIIEPEAPLKDPSKDCIVITYTQKSDYISISNNCDNIKIKKLSLYSSSGAEIDQLKITEDKNQSNIIMNIKRNTTGMYIVKAETTNGEYTKKIIIQ